MHAKNSMLSDLRGPSQHIPLTIVVGDSVDERVGDTVTQIFVCVRDHLLIVPPAVRHLGRRHLGKRHLGGRHLGDVI
jgi:hypothetical protein